MVISLVTWIVRSCAGSSTNTSQDRSAPWEKSQGAFLCLHSSGNTNRVTIPSSPVNLRPSTSNGSSYHNRIRLVIVMLTILHNTRPPIRLGIDLSKCHVAFRAKHTTDTNGTKCFRWAMIVIMVCIQSLLILVTNLTMSNGLKILKVFGSKPILLVAYPSALVNPTIQRTI